MEVDKEVMAWGEELSIRVAVKVDLPLLRGVMGKESEEAKEERWFDLKCEKIPHFCFDCGCLVHPEAGCQAEKTEVKQWGEWLRTAPGKSRKSSHPSRPYVSANRFSSRSAESDPRCRDGVYIRGIPPRRNLYKDYEMSSSSRTGGVEGRRERGEVTNPEKGSSSRAVEHGGCPTTEGDDPKRANEGTFTRRPRKQTANYHQANYVLHGSMGKKRGTKMVWIPMEVQVVGDGSSVCCCLVPCSYLVA